MLTLEIINMIVFTYILEPGLDSLVILKVHSDKKKKLSISYKSQLDALNLLDITKTNKIDYIIHDR